MDDLDFFAVCPPGLERHLAAEVRTLDFQRGKLAAGGVSLRGDLSELYRANLELAGATRVLLRIGEFKVVHFAQLEDKIRDFDWAQWLRADQPLRVDVTTRKSKLYHAGAVKKRFETGIQSVLGCEIGGDDAVTLKVRLENNWATLSLDSSGESLHKRGHKTFTGKAPLRETLASLLLRACDYTAGEPLVDPMCGSGTFVLEAARQSAGLQPGRDRRFAFEYFAGFDPTALTTLRREGRTTDPAPVFFGYDRDEGAVTGAADNATRAGVGDLCRFGAQPLSALTPPDTAPGLVIINPPYGDRIGKKSGLFPLYASLGRVLTERFAGWRVGIVTSHGGLAQATGLALEAGPPIDNGGIKVKLYRAQIPV